MGMHQDVFCFIEKLNKKLYNQYLDIERTLPCKSGLVYVAMQIYLESLIRFVIEVEKLDVKQAVSLGNYLKATSVQNFFLLELEYNDLDELSMINSYANTIKHIKYEELDPCTFMSFIKELYNVSKHIFMFYYPESRQVVSRFDVRYYETIISETNRRERYIEALEDDNSELELLYDEQEKINKRTFKENRNLQTEVHRLENEINQLKDSNSELSTSVLAYKDKVADFDTLKQILATTKQTLDQERTKHLTYKRKYATTKDKYRVTRDAMKEYKHELIRVSSAYNRLNEAHKQSEDQIKSSKAMIKCMLDTSKRCPLSYVLSHTEQRLTVKLDFKDQYKLRKYRPTNATSFYNQTVQGHVMGY